MPDIGLNVMMNVGNPQLAFDFCQIPNKGVGLARLEFIVNNNIAVHPKAVLDYPNVDADLKKAVESAARGSDRKSVVEGKRGGLGGGRSRKEKNEHKKGEDA